MKDDLQPSGYRSESVAGARLSARLASALTARENLLPLALFVASLFLYQATFVPNLSDLNMWDEAAYISSGRELLQGEVPSVGGSPLVSALYAITYLPFSSSPFWLVHSASLGRVILFTLIWLSAWAIARRLPSAALPSLLVGLTFVTPIAASLLTFPSDALYAALAGFALSQVLEFHRTSKVRHAWLTSVWVGLAALARNDGLLLFVVLVIVLLILAPALARWKTLAASVAPFVLLVGGMVIVSGAVSGSYRLGTLERAYLNFESGQQVVFSGTGRMNPVIEARLEAQRQFGTAGDNGYSILRAIQRNPAEYLRRVQALVRELPGTFLEAYGKRFGAVLLILGVWGVIHLLRKRQLTLLLVLIAFPLPILSGFAITLVRPGHLQLWWFSLYVLAAVGLDQMVQGIGSRRVLLAWTLVWGAAAAYGWFGDLLAVYYGAAVILLAVWACHLLARKEALPVLRVAMAAVLLAGGLIIRGGFPSPKVRQLGQAADEQAAVYLWDNYAPGTPVAAGSPGVVQMAGMQVANLSSADVPVEKTPDEFLAWMCGQGIRAVYVDASLYGANPAIWELIEPQIGQGYEVAFIAEEGDVQVLRVVYEP